MDCARPVDGVTVIIAGLIETRDTAGVLRGHRETINPLVHLRGTAPDQAGRGTARTGAVGHGRGRWTRRKLPPPSARRSAYVPGVTESATTAAEARWRWGRASGFQTTPMR